METEKLERKISYKFKKEDLLKEALTHRSYLNENQGWKSSHNERLEFLGDAVLELIVTEILFSKYPNYDEGQLTSFRASLVNYQMMAEVAKEVELENYLLLSKGESKDIGRARDVILANALEALIGAIYLDGGYEKAEVFVVRFIMPRLKEVIEKGLYKDAKSLLQEKTQAKLKITPIYKVLGEEGPDHKKMFNVGVYLSNKLIATGQGLSKQDAEVEAAKKALEEVRKQNNEE
ncbi:MAG: ribonuclease III [Patescibacteria group bacterium]|nr:ribonuclease III [Patescibacteria group bacterium]